MKAYEGVHDLGTSWKYEKVRSDKGPYYQYLNIAVDCILPSPAPIDSTAASSCQLNDISGNKLCQPAPLLSCTSSNERGSFRYSHECPS
jgi:hypothetical protein